MTQPALPPVVEEAVADLWNPLVEEAVADGLRPVGYLCSYVPEALLSLEGLLPLRLRASGAGGTPLADTYLSSVLCSYSRTLLESALEGRFDGLAGWVFAASCDHGRRLYDNLLYLQPPAFVHLLDVPHRDDALALGWFTEELARLAEALTRSFGVDSGSAALAAAIRRENAHRALLAEIGALRRRPDPPLTGAFFHALLTACHSAPRARLAPVLAELRDALAAAPPVAGVRARLLVVGSELDDPGWIRVVESVGGLVVADRFCTGSQPGLEPLPETSDPLRALAEHTLRRTRCPRMMEGFETRLADLVALARDSRADGVILETLKFCDLWGVESVALVSALREAGLPVLRVEREVALTGEGQLRTRVQAFLESLGR